MKEDIFLRMRLRWAVRRAEGISTRAREIMRVRAWRVGRRVRGVREDGGGGCGMRARGWEGYMLV